MLLAVENEHSDTRRGKARTNPAQAYQTPSHDRSVKPLVHSQRIVVLGRRRLSLLHGWAMLPTADYNSICTIRPTDGYIGLLLRDSYQAFEENEAV